MTTLQWDVLLMILGCATIVLGFLVTWNGKAIYKKIRAGVVIAWMWVYAKRQDSAKRD